jgi:hypothetical protein
MPDTALVLPVVRLVAGSELRHFFRDARNLVWIPLSLVSIFVALWPYIGSPMVPVCLVVWFGLDRQYSNILFSSPHEVRALALFPPRWRELVLGKNLAAILLTAFVFAFVSIVTLYFSPRIISFSEIAMAVLYGASVEFPLLALGNLRSIQSPRPRGGLITSDMVEGCITLVLAGVCSIPYAVFVLALEEPLLCLLYALGTVWLWALLSRTYIVPRVQARQIPLCEAT